MTTKVNGVNVSVSGDLRYSIDNSEIQAYIDKYKSLHPERKLNELNINIQKGGQDLDLEYKYENPVKFERIRRITGYLVGDMGKWNNAKTSEEQDRVKHSLDKNPEYYDNYNSDIDGFCDSSKAKTLNDENDKYVLNELNDSIYSELEPGAYKVGNYQAVTLNKFGDPVALSSDEIEHFTKKGKISSAPKGLDLPNQAKAQVSVSKDER